MKKEKLKFHYAWAVCFATMLLVFCNIGLSSNILAVYLPFIEERGITGTQGSSLVTVRCVFSFISTFFVAAYYEKLSLRAGAALATLCCAISSVVSALAGDNILIYRIAAGIYGVAYGFGSMIPMALIIENWFKARKGLAVGLSTIGSGLANVIFTPAVTSMVLKHGLRFSYLVQAGFVFVSTVVIFAIIRDNPESMGLCAFGADAADEERNDASARRKIEGVSMSRGMTAAVYIMLILLGGAGQCGAGHISIVSVSSGYSASSAALIVTVYSIVLIAGKFACGAAVDSMGAKKAGALFMIIGAAGTVSACLMDGHSVARAMAFACLMGFGYAVFNIGIPLWAADLSSQETHRKVLKNFQIVYAAGGIVFSSVPGRIADVTGEYKSSFVMVGVMLIVSAALLSLVYKKTRNE